jgi:hypothetical protein
MLVRERPGHELFNAPAIQAGVFQFRKESGGTNTSGTYVLTRNGQKLGQLSLSFDPHERKVFFDILIKMQGENFGIRALQSLAKTVADYGFTLQTKGLLEGSLDYWSKLESKGLVSRIEGGREYAILATRD